MKDDPQNMPRDALTAWLRAHLKNEPHAPALLDRRREEAPYERPAQLWKTAGERFTLDFPWVVLALLREAVREPWTAEAFNQLMRLVEKTDLSLVRTELESLARSQALVKQPDGARLHMQALRTLLALGWNGTVNFWRGQEKFFDGHWPGIIFKGLARHGLDVAFRPLPQLVRTREEMRDVLGLFPRLMENVPGGMTRLRDEMEGVLDQLPPAAAELSEEWFQLQGFPLRKQSSSRRFGSVLNGIRSILGSAELVPATASLAGRLATAHAR